MVGTERLRVFDSLRLRDALVEGHALLGGAVADRSHSRRLGPRPLERLLHFDVVFFSANQVDHVDAQDHFLLGEAVFEELILRDLGSIPEEIRQDSDNLSEKLAIG